MAVIRDVSCDTRYYFNKIPYKESNLIKVIIFSETEGIEEVFAIVDDVTKDRIESGIIASKFIVRLASNSRLYPFPSWGLHVLCRYNRKGMPIVNTTWMNLITPSMRIISPRIETNILKRISNWFINLFYKS